MKPPLRVTMIRVPTIVDASASTAPVTPPIGLAYLQRVVREFTDDISIVDAVGERPEFRRTRLESDDESEEVHILGLDIYEILNKLNEFVDVILVSCMFSQDWLYTRVLINEIRKKCPDALIVAGGEHITAAPEFSISDAEGLDICVLGEGESTLFEILKAYCSGVHYPDSIPGTVVRSGGSAKRNSVRRRISTIDSIGWPDWSGFPLENYFLGGFAFGVNLGGVKTMPVLASRGCPYTCTFCSSPSMWGTKWRARDVDDLIAEIKEYKKKYGAENFDFFDLTAIVQRKWIVEFCEKVIEQKLDISWQLPSGTRSEAIDFEVARLMFRAGCKNLSYAPESGSDKVLKIIQKRISLEKMVDSVRGSVRAGLNVKANMMCGFPEETTLDLWKNLRFISRLSLAGCHDLSINQFSPYPGSDLFENLSQCGKVTLDRKYFQRLSFYSSMTNAYSYSEYLSSKQILLFKAVGTLTFYFLSFLRYPGRVFTTIRNVSRGVEFTRLEKTLLSYKRRQSA